MTTVALPVAAACGIVGAIGITQMAYGYSELSEGMKEEDSNVALGGIMIGGLELGSGAMLCIGAGMVIASVACPPALFIAAALCTATALVCRVARWWGYFRPSPRPAEMQALTLIKIAK